ncbi:MAG: ImuA family protein [Phycisphaerae bacterium]
MRAELTEKIRKVTLRHAALGVARRGAVGGQTPCLPTGWEPIDAALQGGLTCGGLHEWIGVDLPETVDRGARRRGRCATPSAGWSPPLAPILALTWQLLETRPLLSYTIWIGANCFPYPYQLLRARGEDRRLLLRTLLVHAARPADRLWAADLALRCPAIGCVVLDGSRFDMPATQRLQLLSQSQQTPVLMIRPPWERHELSAAQTRWRVSYEAPPRARRFEMDSRTRAVCPPLPELSMPAARRRAFGNLEWRGVSPAPEIPRPRWRVELLRCKGVALTNQSRSWIMEWDDATHAVRLPAEVRGAPADAPRPAAVDAHARRETA